MSERDLQAGEIDTGKPHSARMYDYFLGGKTHYAADEAAGERVLAVWPAARAWARANRAFMHRATRWLTAEAGIRQFLDIGSGIPTEPNLHRIAQETAPEARVVYVDNDPIVLNYAAALLNGKPEGRTAYLHGDVREPARILGSPRLRGTLDLREPVALSLNALLHFLPDEQNPYELVARLMAELAPGSYLVLSHGVPARTEAVRDAVTNLYRKSGIFVQGRTREQVAAFFDGLELVEPGVVRADHWKPVEEPVKEELSLCAGVARKP